MVNLQRVMLFLGLLAAMGCQGTVSEREPEAAVLRELDGVPGLVPVPVALPPNEQPWGPISLAIAPNGVVAYLFGAGGPPFLTLIDTNGVVTSRAGGQGEGPGELSGLGVVLPGADDFVVYDTRKAAAVRFAVHDGKSAGESRLLALGFPLAVVGDSIDVFDAEFAMRRQAPEIVRVPLAGGEPRRLLTEADSTFRHAIGLPFDAPRNANPLPWFADGTYTAWGDGMGYNIRVTKEGSADTLTVHRSLAPNRRGNLTLQLLRESLERSPKTMRMPNGRLMDVPGRAERLDTLEREVVPHFGWGGLGMDARGRLVTVGPVGDSTFVDFFDDTVFVGRIVVDCFSPGRVAVGKDRIAAHCRSRDPTEQAFTLRIWRIR